jgi:hypothetical protein
MKDILTAIFVITMAFVGPLTLLVMCDHLAQAHVQLAIDKLNTSIR